MKKEKRKMLGLIGVIVSSALLIACIAAWLGGFDFSRLWRPFVVTYETKSYPIESSFSGIEVSAANANITICPSTDGKVQLTTRENEDDYFTVRVENGVLCIRQQHERAWSFGIDPGPRLTLALPPTEYAALTIASRSGDIGVAANLLFDQIALTASSGDIECFAVSHGLTAKTSSGDLTVENAGGRISAQTASGDLALNHCTASALSAVAASGDLTVQNLQSSGEISLKTSSGDQTLRSVTAATVSANATSGDIALTDVVADIKLTVETTSGDVDLTRVDGGELALGASSGDICGTLRTPKYYDARASSGSISLPAPDPVGGLCYVRTSSGSIRLTVEP